MTLPPAHAIAVPVGSAADTRLVAAGTLFCVVAGWAVATAALVAEPTGGDPGSKVD